MAKHRLRVIVKCRMFKIEKVTVTVLNNVEFKFCINWHVTKLILPYTTQTSGNGYINPSYNPN